MSFTPDFLNNPRFLNAAEHLATGYVKILTQAAKRHDKINETYYQFNEERDAAFDALDEFENKGLRTIQFICDAAYGVETVNLVLDYWQRKRSQRFLKSMATMPAHAELLERAGIPIAH